MISFKGYELVETSKDKGIIKNEKGEKLWDVDLDMIQDPSFNIRSKEELLQFIVKNAGVKKRYYFHKGYKMTVDFIFDTFRVDDEKDEHFLYSQCGIKDIDFELVFSDIIRTTENLKKQKKNKINDFYIYNTAYYGKYKIEKFIVWDTLVTYAKIYNIETLKLCKLEVLSKQEDTMELQNVLIKKIKELEN